MGSIGRVHDPSPINLSSFINTSVSYLFVKQLAYPQGYPSTRYPVPENRQKPLYEFPFQL